MRYDKMFGKSSLNLLSILNSSLIFRLQAPELVIPYLKHSLTIYE